MPESYSDEIYHLGKEKHTVSPQKNGPGGKEFVQTSGHRRSKQNRTLAIHRWMKYAAIITVILLTGTGITYWIGQNALINNKMMIAVASEGNVEEIVLPDGTGCMVKSTVSNTHANSPTKRNIWKVKPIRSNKNKQNLYRAERSHAGKGTWNHLQLQEQQACKSAEPL